MVTDEILDQPFPETITTVGVKVRENGEIKKARTEESGLRVGDHVMLRLDNELTYGTVHLPPQTIPFLPPMRVMKSVLRKATEQDVAMIAEQKRLALDGWAFCRERATALGLQMKLVEVYGAMQKRVLTFRYTAESRVDFRQLVKDLARQFSCRIEMRQISSRDEARTLSGVDTCGLVLCCASFLTDFNPVNGKLAKGERWGGSQDGHRIGVCGRLKCCLLFEQEEFQGSASPQQTLIQPTRV